MGQARSEHRFVDEHAHEVCVCTELWQDAFQHAGFSEALLTFESSQEDLGHPTEREPIEQHVFAESFHLCAHRDPRIF